MAEAAAENSGHRVAQALRVALAAAITLAIAEWWYLPHGNLAVWTTHMIMSSYTHSIFQKGLERVGGRAVGIVLGILIVEIFGELTPLALALEIAGMFALFYAHFCGRLAYTYMNAGLYLNGVVMLNTAGPSAAYVNGGWMLLALVLGVGVAYLVTWLTGAERDFSIDPGPGRLFPLRGEALARSAQMVTTMMLCQYIFFAVDLPSDANLFSLFLFSVIPDVQSMVANRRYFLGGILWGTLAAVPAYLVLNRLPHFPLFVAIIAFAMFIASWVGQSKGGDKAIGSEFGTVFPLLVIAPFAQVASPATTFYNILALYAYVAIALLMGHLWVGLGWVSDKRGVPAGGRITAPAQK